MEHVLAVGDAAASRRIVLLHGHAGSPEAMLDVATALHVAAAAQVLLPRGPLVADDGWAWWRPGSPGEAATLGTVRSLTEDGPPDTVLAGFSQGGAMALWAVATSPAIAAGLVVVAGFVPDELEVPGGPRGPGGPRRPGGSGGSAYALPPVLVLHGEHDEAVDPMHGRRVARWCERAGAPEVDLVTYAADHAWVPETTTALVSWLERR
jgi:predicted esterase